MKNIKKFFNITDKLIELNFFIILVLFVLAGYLIYQSKNPQFDLNSFFNNALANLYGTVVGAVLGIPIAITIFKWQQKDEIKRIEKDEMIRRQKILNVINDELKYNLDGFIVRIYNIKDEAVRNVLVDYKFKDVVWNAFSDGGEVQYIHDVELLKKITDAYYFIRIMIFLEERYFDAAKYPGKRGDANIPKEILQFINNADPKVKKSITTAMREIKKHIN